MRLSASIIPFFPKLQRYGCCSIQSQWVNIRTTQPNKKFELIKACIVLNTSSNIKKGIKIIIFVHMKMTPIPGQDRGPERPRIADRADVWRLPPAPSQRGQPGAGNWRGLEWQNVWLHGKTEIWLLPFSNSLHFMRCLLFISSDSPRKNQDYDKIKRQKIENCKLKIMLTAKRPN